MADELRQERVRQVELADAYSMDDPPDLLELQYDFVVQHVVPAVVADRNIHLIEVTQHGYEVAVFSRDNGNFTRLRAVVEQLSDRISDPFPLTVRLFEIDDFSRHVVKGNVCFELLIEFRHVILQALVALDDNFARTAKDALSTSVIFSQRNQRAIRIRVLEL